MANLNDWSNVAIAAISAAGGGAAVARWLYRRASQALAGDVAAILKQLQPNSGTSLHDRVGRLETSQKLQTDILLELRRDMHHRRKGEPEPQK